MEVRPGFLGKWIEFYVYAADDNTDPSVRARTRWNVMRYGKEDPFKEQDDNDRQIAQELQNQFDEEGAHNIEEKEQEEDEDGPEVYPGGGYQSQNAFNTKQPMYNYKDNVGLPDEEDYSSPDPLVKSQKLRNAKSAQKTSQASLKKQFRQPEPIVYGLDADTQKMKNKNKFDGRKSTQLEEEKEDGSHHGGRYMKTSLGATIDAKNSIVYYDEEQR